jgi:hypothetical protein
MSKFVGVIIGGLEIAVGIVSEILLPGNPLGIYLIASGVGMVLSGIGTLLSQGPLTGTATLSRNPIAPWNVVYGRQKVGGILVHISEHDDSNKYLDLVVVLACHACKSVDALLFDGQRVRLDSNGCSFEPTQQTVSFASVTRVNDVVTAVVASAITDLQTGDSLIMQNVSDHTFNGRYAVTVISPTSFSYICGGTATTVSGSGQAVTVWPNYKAKIHMEVLLGDHTATFPGMLNGTPYDGDPGNLVTYPNNPWTAQHKLLGKTSVFLRLHYNDEIFANGLPTIAFRVSGKNDIYDPRASAISNILQRPTTLLNGWGNNAHVGAYELGVDQGYNFGLNNDVTDGYQNPDNAVDASLSTNASAVILHNHIYAGCVWQFASLAASPVPGTLYLNILSSVDPFTFTGRSAGIWYTLDNGTTWTQVYNSPDHPKGWDSIPLSPTTDTSLLQVMAFTDAHDDMAHYVYDIQLSTGPGTSNADGTGYSENSALCIADYLAHPVWGFKAVYGTEIPLDKLISAANICDEAVPTAAGGTVPRYDCNGGFPLTVKRGEVLQNLLTSCGGRLTYTQGQFVIWPAAWLGGSLLSPPPFPFPPPAGQSVAWSTATSHSTVDILQSSGPAYFVAGRGGSGLTYGALGLMNGGPISANTVAQGWSGFAMPPEIPVGATITGVYPVVSLSPSSIIGGFTRIGGSGWIYVPSVPGNYIGPNVGTLAGQSVTAAITNSSPNKPVPPHNDIELSLGIDWIGFAVYYEGEPLPTAPVIIKPFGDTAPTLAMAAGPFRWREKVSIRDLYNGVKGTYISPANNWQSSDIPPYAQDIDHGYMSGSPMYPFGDANLAADGGDRRWLDIQLPFTIQVATAQRLCKIELMRRRQQGTGTFSYNMAMYKTAALDVVSMTLPLLRWTNKLLEIAAHRFTMNKMQIDGNDVTLLGTEIDVQETDPSVYDWSSTEELTAQGFQQPTIPGSINGGGSTLVNNSNYANTPAISLSQPDATHIALDAVSTSFTSRTVNYNARSISIADPGGTPTWYYVTIQDADYLGDQSPQLAVFAELTTAKVGIAGYTYMGAIQVTHTAGASATPLPGGWPAPTSYVNVP